MANLTRLANDPVLLFASLEAFLKHWVTALWRDPPPHVVRIKPGEAFDFDLSDWEFPFEIGRLYELQRAFPELSIGSPFHLIPPVQLDESSIGIGRFRDAFIYRIHREPDRGWRIQFGPDRWSDMNWTPCEFAVTSALGSLLTRTIRVDSIQEEKRKGEVVTSCAMECSELWSRESHFFGFHESGFLISQIRNERGPGLTSAGFCNDLGYRWLDEFCSSHGVRLTESRSGFI